MADDLLVLRFSLFALGKLGNLTVAVFVDNTAVDIKVTESHDVLRKCARFVREDVVNLIMVIINNAKNWVNEPRIFGERERDLTLPRSSFKLEFLATMRIFSLDIIPWRTNKQKYVKIK